MSWCLFLRSCKNQICKKVFRNIFLTSSFMCRVVISEWKYRIAILYRVENFKMQLNGKSKHSLFYALKLLGILRQKPFKMGLSKWTVVFQMVVVGWLIHWCFNTEYFHAVTSRRFRIKCACWWFIKVNGMNSSMVTLQDISFEQSGRMLEARLDEDVALYNAYYKACIISEIVLLWWRQLM